MSTSVVLNSGTNLTGSTVTQSVSWGGGRSVLLVDATQFAAKVDLQLQLMGGAWVAVNAATISANAAQNFDLPAGQYRMLSTQGSSLAVYATLVRIPYT